MNMSREKVVFGVGFLYTGGYEWRCYRRGGLKKRGWSLIRVFFHLESIAVVRRFGALRLRVARTETDSQIDVKFDRSMAVPTSLEHLLLVRFFFFF